MNDQLTHLDERGTARMVDVSTKPDSVRMARARGSVYMAAKTLGLIKAGMLKKGDVLTVARLAGIMAAKRTAELIPLCHPIPLTYVEVVLEFDETASAVHIEAVAQTTGKTGVEMEAMTAVSVAALTVYDMAKAVDRRMRLDNIHLVEKRGGQRGDFEAGVEDAG